MAAPARTTTDAVVTAARELIERDGLDALTMQAVARVVGVRAPSLYKRVDGRDALVTLVANQVAEELASEIDEALDGRDPAGDLRALATTFRGFAHRNPASYLLLFSPGHAGVSPTSRLRSVASLRDVAARLAGEEHELAAARLVTSWIHGWVAMELAGSFQLGGDLEEAWEYALDRLVAALRT